MKLPKIVAKRGKRIGRGMGSGKGSHTVGRGQKGQKTRNKIHVLFEGVKVKKSLLKRLPFQRGRGKFAPGKKPVIVNLAALDAFKAGEKVTLEALIKKGLVNARKAKKCGVKILGNGKISKKLTIELPVSKSVGKKLNV